MALLAALGAARRRDLSQRRAGADPRPPPRGARRRRGGAGRARAAPLAELRAEDLRLAWRSLGQITGTVDVEDLLDVIFRDFCVGK